MALRFPAESPLHQFTEDEVSALFAAGTSREYAIDEAVVTEGEPGESMFFVLEGYAGGRLESGAMARSYSPGTYFGELSFISPGHLRSATIVATTRLKVQIIDQASVQTLLSTHPRLVFTLLRRACVFLVDAERNLISDLRRRNMELRETVQKLDATRARLSEEEQRARTDFLTGLTNRRGFDADLPQFISRAGALGTSLALLTLDLDGFKQLNDTRGHAAGDGVLRDVGRVLQQGVRKTDLPCRFGGDEFVLVLADLGAEAVQARAEALRVSISALNHVTATMGGTLYRVGESPEAWLQRADEALYAAKRSGRNQLGWLD